MIFYEDQDTVLFKGFDYHFARRFRKKYPRKELQMHTSLDKIIKNGKIRKKKVSCHWVSLFCYFNKASDFNESFLIEYYKASELHYRASKPRQNPLIPISLK